MLKECFWHNGFYNLKQMNNLKLFRAAIFHSLNATHFEFFEDGLLVVKDGKIEQVGAFDDIYTQFVNAPFTEYQNALIMPGFIDSHLHYPQYKIIGSYGKKLIDWLNTYTFVEEQKFCNASYAKEIAKLFFEEILRNGTTTAMSFCTSHVHSVDAYFEEAIERNMRMLGGKVMMDRNAPEPLCDEAKTSYRHSKELIEKWHCNGRLLYSVTPRFAPTSSPEQLRLAGLLLKEFQGNATQKSVLLQTHINENVDEINWVKKLYPDNKNYLDVYDTYEILSEHSVFGHCIHNQMDELKLLGDSGSKVALCPSSNLFLGSGLFDLAQLEKFGIECALASDIGGGDSFSMFDVMNQAYKICQLEGYSLEASKAFYLTTLGAAKVLSIDDCLGNFEKGKEADFIVIDLEATELIKERLSVTSKIEEKLFALMMLGDDRLISETHICGKIQYSKRNQNR